MTFDSSFLKKEGHGPIENAIKIIGIGKKRLLSLEKELVFKVIQAIEKKPLQAVLEGALVGCLLCKELNPSEKELLGVLGFKGNFSLEDIAYHFCNEASKDIFQITLKLLKKQTLLKEEAFLLGEYLFSKNCSQKFIGFICMVLRIRYETIEEFTGLLQALEASLRNSFKKNIFQKPFIQWAEPMDGFNKSYVLSPLLRNHFLDKRYESLFLCCESSGPKEGLNLKKIGVSLGISFVKEPQDFLRKINWGYFVDLENLYPSFSKWIFLRRSLIKRPFLATLEKLLNPFGADIVVASAFHGPYMEKMVSIAEARRYQACMISKWGNEGGLMSRGNRSIELLCSVKTNGGYKRKLIKSKVINSKVKKDENFDGSLEFNKSLILNYLKKGTMGISFWDDLFQVSLEVYLEGLDFIQSK